MKKEYINFDTFQRVVLDNEKMFPDELCEVLNQYIGEDDSLERKNKYIKEVETVLSTFSPTHTKIIKKLTKKRFDKKILLDDLRNALFPRYGIGDNEDYDSVNDDDYKPLEDNEDYDSVNDDDNKPLEDTIDDTEYYTGSEEKSEQSKLGYFKIGKGLSIVSLIDLYFNTKILKEFSSEFCKINPSDKDYLKQTNKLIEEVALYSFSNNVQEIIEVIKNYFELEFSKSVKEEEILYELVADELRCYQQLYLTKVPKASHILLGNAIKITKARDTKGIDLETIYEPVNVTNIPHYAFKQSAFNKPFKIVTKKSRLSYDFAEKYLTGNTFMENPAKVEICDGTDGFVVYSSSISNSKFVSR